MSTCLKKKTVLSAITVVLGVVAGLRIWTAVGKPAVAAAETRTLMDIETGKLIHVRVTEGFGPFPMVHPRTGERTLYPTEVCYANDCAAKGGTCVILNTYLDKQGPTRCPACGAKVRFHNPGPGQSARSEPEQSEAGGW